MTIRSARTQSVELAVPLTTLNNVSFGCLWEEPSLAFPERPGTWMGLKMRDAAWVGCCPHHSPLSLCLLQQRFWRTRQDKANVVVQRREERKRKRKGGGRREKETKNEDGQKGREGGRKNYRKGWRGMEEGTGRKGMKRGRRERDREKEAWEREIDKEIESQRGLALRLQYISPVLHPRSQIVPLSEKLKIKLTT